MPRVSLSALASTLGAFVALVDDPHDLRRFHALERRLLALTSAHDRRRIIERYHRSREISAMLAARYLAPAHDVTELVWLPATSLGGAYARFLLDNSLHVDFYPDAPLTDDLMYFRARMLQTHDIWHVLLGAAPDVAGELQVIGFTIGQLQRSLPGDLLAVSFLYMMAFAYLAHTARRRPWQLFGAVRRFVAGRRAGRACRPLFGVQWERMWGRPLAALRQEYLTPPFISAALPSGDGPTDEDPSSSAEPSLLLSRRGPLAARSR